MTRTTHIAAIAVVTALAGCSPGDEQVAAPAPEASGAVEPSAAPAPDGLGRAGEDVFGLAAPAGVELEEARDSLRHYRINAPFDDILAFYRTQVPDGQLTRYERGAKIETPDGRSVYIYRELGESDYLLTYFDGTQPAVGDPANSAVDGAVAPERAMLDQGFGAPTEDGATAGNPGSQTPPTAAESDPWATEPALPGRDGPASLGFRVINRNVHPRLRDDQATQPRPIDFVRGVHEPRRNPDAQF
jgi:hypothetical protein